MPLLPLLRPSSSSSILCRGLLSSSSRFSRISSLSPSPPASVFKTAPRLLSTSHARPLLPPNRLHPLNTTRAMSSAASFYDFEPVDKTGKPFPLANLKGKVILVVNTASKCGFTPQFKGLETLYQSIKSKHPEIADDFTILGFPCNQFGSQDPGSNDDIQSFCQVNYGVTFPVLGKLDVNGENAAPVFTWLKEEMSGMMGLKRVKWNFEKFLVSADGKVVGRWASTTKPEGLEGTILQEIEKAKKDGTLSSAKGGEQAKLS